MRPTTHSFRCVVEDERAGPVELSGRLLLRSSSEIVVALHGLGGSVDSGYMGLLLRAADQAGRSCLLLNCRGADRSGADVYHSGLIDDLKAALKSDQLALFRYIDLLGYSVGGHIVYSYACSDLDPRVRRVAAVCAPLDLGEAARDFDRPALSVYRTHVLDALKEMYTVAYQRRPTGLVPEQARKLSRIVSWDEAIIAPRFGFRDAEDYYQSQSVGPRLSELRVDALYVGATCDPMVRASHVRRYLEGSRVRAVWDDRAGHLGFRKGFDLGFFAPPGLESQVLAWLSR